MMNKKFTKPSLVIIFFVGLAALATAFGQTKNKQTATSQEGTLSRVRRTGVIEACAIVSPPTFKDAKTGELSGHVIDTLYAIADRMKVEVNWHESTWGNAVADLQSKRCDVLAAPFFATIQRAQAVAFTKPPLFYAGHGAIIKKDDERFKNLKNVFEFDKPDIKIAVSTGEAGDIFVKEHFKYAQITRIDVESSDLSRFALEVSAGRADVAIGGVDVTSLYTNKHPEVVDLFEKQPFGLSPVGWATRQDDYRWLNFLETSLQYLETQGIIRKLEKKHNAHWLHDKKEYELW